MSLKKSIQEETKKHQINPSIPWWKALILIIILVLFSIGIYYSYLGYSIEVLSVVAMIMFGIGILLSLVYVISKETFLWLIGKRSEYNKVFKASQVVSIGAMRAAIKYIPIGLDKEEKERLKADVPIFVQMQFMRNINNQIQRVFIGAFAAAFGLLGTIVLMKQNTKIDTQNILFKEQNVKIAVQNKLFKNQNTLTTNQNKLVEKDIRPYLMYSTAYTPQNGFDVMLLDLLSGKVLNSPAKKTFTSVCHYIIKENSQIDTLLFWENKNEEIWFPFNNAIYGFSINKSDLEKIISLLVNEEIYREIKVHYTWIGGDRKNPEYFFNGKWLMNNKEDGWKVLKIEAN